MKHFLIFCILSIISVFALHMAKDAKEAEFIRGTYVIYSKVEPR